MKETVVVVMSGGVDSSVAAALMKENGYNVIGITLQLYDQGAMTSRKGACCAGQDIYDAKNIADQIDIPHYVLNYEKRFNESVIMDFVDSYSKGQTPLPCVKCNQTVKFQDLMEFAKQLGAARLITGHYVRKIHANHGPELHCGVADHKDQSYFLFSMTKEQLEFLDFPLGSMKKEETRELAKKFGLKVFDKPLSQDICFVPNGDYKEVVLAINPELKKTGKIMHIESFEIGMHEGIINYTIGQRRGLGIAYPQPLYVIKIDASKNIIKVGEEKYLNCTRFSIKELNWLGEEELGINHLSVKIRSTKPKIEAIITKISNTEASVQLLSDEKGVAPGEACVFYQGSRVLGGGWIF